MLLQRFAIAGNGVAVAFLAVSLFPEAFGVVVEDGSWLPLFGVLIMAASGIAEFAGSKMEVSRRHA